MTSEEIPDSTPKTRTIICKKNCVHFVWMFSTHSLLVGGMGQLVGTCIRCLIPSQHGYFAYPTNKNVSTRSTRCAYSTYFSLSSLSGCFTADEKKKNNPHN